MRKIEQFLLELHNLEEAEWCIIDDNGATRIGLYRKGSKVYLDLFARRFYSAIEMSDISRKVYPAKEVPTSEKGMIAFEAVDDPTEFIVLPENFIQKIYGTTIYQPWMEEKLLL